MSLRGLYPWGIRSGHARPYVLSDSDFFDDFPFSALVPQWRRHPFEDFQQILARDGRQQGREEVAKRRVGSKNIGHASDDKNFTYNFNLSGFEPKDIKVKTVGQKVVVEAESEENEHKEGCHSFCHRHYHRTLLLPKNVKPESIKSSLTAEGVLSITAPKLAIEAAVEKEHEICVERADPEAVEDAPMAEEAS